MNSLKQTNSFPAHAHKKYIPILLSCIVVAAVLALIWVIFHQHSGSTSSKEQPVPTEMTDAEKAAALAPSAQDTVQFPLTSSAKAKILKSQPPSPKSAGGTVLQPITDAEKQAALNAK